MFARFKSRPSTEAPRPPSIAMTSPTRPGSSAAGAPPRLELDLSDSVSAALSRRLPRDPGPQITITSPSTIAPDTPLSPGAGQYDSEPLPVPPPVPAPAEPQAEPAAEQHEVFALPPAARAYELANPSAQTGGATPSSTPPPKAAKPRRPGLFKAWSSSDKAARASVHARESGESVRAGVAVGKSKVRHEAGVLFAVLTGVLPGVDVVSRVSADGRRDSMERVREREGKAVEGRVVPHVSAKSLNKLKEGLMKPVSSIAHLVWTSVVADSARVGAVGGAQDRARGEAARSAIGRGRRRG